jgi:hypothetical protein
LKAQIVANVKNSFAVRNRDLTTEGLRERGLDALGAKIVPASVDPIDKAWEVAANVAFPIGYGVTRDIANSLGAFWDNRRNIIQPLEFLVVPTTRWSPPATAMVH